MLSRITLNALSVMTVCQCGHKLHRTISLSWINVCEVAYHAFDLQLLNAVITLLCGMESTDIATFLFLLLLPPEINKAG